jgi:predicted NUDIX family NTP pyrophosphohydrolase
MARLPSAGLLLYRGSGAAREVLLGHMGGPFWARKDERAWSIPKGEYEADEDPLAAARREFTEELGAAPPTGPYTELGTVRQSGGKLVTVWAVEGDFDPSALISNTFELEWPPRSGQRQSFPELDRVGWFGLDEARAKVIAGQLPLIDRFVS